MSQTPLIVERTYNAPVAKVWEALTNPEQMRHWYFDIPGFKPEVGFEFSFSAKGKEGEDYHHECRITEVVPLSRLTHSWRYRGHPGDSSVTFELTPEGNKTHVKLTHTGLESFPPVSAFARENFVEGWNQIIGKGLKEFVEQA